MPRRRDRLRRAVRLADLLPAAAHAARPQAAFDAKTLPELLQTSGAAAPVQALWCRSPDRSCSLRGAKPGGRTHISWVGNRGQRHSDEALVA